MGRSAWNGKAEMQFSVAQMKPGPFIVGQLAQDWMPGRHSFILQAAHSRIGEDFIKRSEVQVSTPLDSLGINGHGCRHLPEFAGQYGVLSLRDYRIVVVRLQVAWAAWCRPRRYGRPRGVLSCPQGVPLHGGGRRELALPWGAAVSKLPPAFGDRRGAAISPRAGTFSLQRQLGLLK